MNVQSIVSSLENHEIASVIVDRIGITSIGSTVAIKAGQSAGVIEIQTYWTMTDYALLISMIGGVTFIIKNLFEIYLSYRKNKNKNN